MLNLLKKEFCLAMHPITPAMILLSAMTLIPNYPYTVIFFYVTMAIFFTCLLGRENNDVIYSLNLPVPKRSIVKARILFAVVIEMIQLVVMIPFVLLSRKVNPAGNAAGMDANLALFAQGLIVYGLFNLVFFTSYYQNVAKVGISFIKSNTVILICTVLDIVATYAVPFVRDALDTRDPACLPEKLLALAVGAALFTLMTMLSYRIGVRRFDKQDLN